MSEVCPEPGALVDLELGRLATQYREATKFKGYLSAILTQVEGIIAASCAIPSFFDINTATGDQLTLIGKRLGFGRCHCVCDASPVFGFACDDPMPGPPIVGFCEAGTWRGCGGESDLCISDDEAYRGHLLARRYQMLGLYDLTSLTAALRSVWGEDAWVPMAAKGRVVVAPGRELDTQEIQRISLTLRVLPIAPSMEMAVHFGSDPVAGFGAGWGGFCVPGTGHWLCPTVLDPYSCDPDCDPPVFGFDCGEDLDVQVAGFGDEGTWAACL